jgi:large subunit ribosomal protein L6
MSRVGKSPILIPQYTNVEISSNIKKIKVQGLYGTLVETIPNEVYIKKIQVLSPELGKNAGEILYIFEKASTQSSREKAGLTRTLISNMVVGVSQQFCYKLQMVGVGYKGAILKNTLLLNVGFSHPVSIIIPDSIHVVVENNTSIILRGINKATLSFFASKVRSIRPPEPYKGKGIRYDQEYILRKAGKSNK